MEQHHPENTRRRTNRKIGPSAVLPHRPAMAHGRIAWRAVLLALITEGVSCTSLASPPGLNSAAIIDTHAHIRLTETDAVLSMQPRGTTVLRRLDQESGVSRSALIVVARAGDMPRTRAQNDAVIAAAAADPAHFFPVASVHPADGEASLVELVRIAARQVKVIKLHPNTQNFDVADPAVARIVERCGELGLTVLFDSYKPWDASEIGKFVLLSARQPQTRFILAHMGFTQFRDILAFAELRKIQAGGRNVWFDISAIITAYAGSPLVPELVWTMRQVGMDRFLFGSDWPVDEPAHVISAVRQLGLTPVEERQLFHDNAAALLGD